MTDTKTLGADAAGSESLRSTDKHLRLAAESAHFGTYEHDFVSGTNFWSRETRWIGGLADDDLDVSLERVVDLVHPEDREQVRRRIDASLDPHGAGDFESEHRLVRPDGTTRWVFMKGSTTFRGEGAERHPVRNCGIVLDVTERKHIEQALKQREEALRESEERFSRFMEHLPGLAWIKDLHGRYVYANDAAAAAFGMRRDQLYGRTDEEIFPSKTAVQFRDNDARALRREAGIQTVETLEHEDGVVHHSLVNKFPIPGLDERSTLVGGMAIDITERMQAESALRESEERFRLLADSSPVLIWVNGLEGCEFVNDTYRAFLGVTAADVRGYDWVEFVHPEDRQGYVAAYRQAAERRDTFEAEFRFRRHDGTYRWMTSVGRPRFGPTGELVGYVGSTFDVTERKQAEQTLHSRARQLQALVKIGDVALREHDVQKLFDYTTATVAETLGVELTKVLQLLPGGDELLLRSGVGWKPGLVGTATVEADTRSQAGYTLASDSPVVVADLRQEERFRAPTLLTDHDVQSGMSCIIRDPDGGPWGVLGIHTTQVTAFTENDVAFIVAVANSLGNAVARLRSEEALKEADRRKDEFLATLAHELRNPLAPLSTGLEVTKLAKDPLLVDQARAMMERQMSHLVRLVDDLLDLSRISCGKIDLRRERLPLSTVIQQAVEASKPSIDQGAHRLTITMPPESIHVDGDLIRLAQVFSNLLNNAAKFTPNGGNIQLTVERHGGDALVSVRDDGLGIPGHLLPRVFDMFTQVHRSPGHPQGGLGIGLALVKALVGMHSGSIEICSAGLQKGTTVSVRLPVAAPLPQAAAPGSEPAAAATPHRILVVDDNRDAALSLAMLLDLMGNETRTAHDGLEAIEIAAQFQPEIILLDIGMPKVDGYEAARRLRERHGAGVVLVALTGWGQDEDRRRSQEAGFDLHLVKPVEIAALEDLLAGIGSTA